MEYQQAEILILLHYQQELIIMLQLMQNFSVKNGNPIKCCMLLSKYKIQTNCLMHLIHIKSIIITS